MYFLFPGYLFLLPLALLPLLWHRVFKQKLLRLEIPSLYFLSRILKERAQNRLASPTLLMFLEMLFILLIILAFAHPVPRALTAGVSRLAVFFDNSPSLRNAKVLTEAELVLGGLLEKKEVSIFTWKEVREDHLPSRMDSARDLADYFSGMEWDNSAPQFRDLSSYLARHRDLLGTQDVEVILFSDLRANHFRRDFRFDGRGPAWLVQEVPPSPQLSVEKVNNPIRFVGDAGVLRARVTGFSGNGSGTIRLFHLDGTSRKLRHASEVSRGAGEVQEISLRMESPGIHSYEMIFSEADEIKSRHYFSLYTCPPLRLSLYPGDRSPVQELFRAMLDYDIKKGNVIPDQVNADLFLAGGFARPEELLRFRGKKGILFLTSGMGIRDLNEVLGRGLGLDLLVRKEKEISMRLKTIAHFPPPWELLTPDGVEKDIVFSRYYQTESPGTLLAWEDESPFLIKSGDVFLITGDPDPRRSDFLGSPLALPLILETLKSLSMSRTISYESPSGPSVGAGLRPRFLNLSEKLTVPTGIYESEQRLVHVNEAPEERLSETIENTRKYFPNLHKIQGAELAGSPGLLGGLTARSVLMAAALILLLIHFGIYLASFRRKIT